MIQRSNVEQPEPDSQVIVDRTFSVNISGPELNVDRTFSVNISGPERGAVLFLMMHFFHIGSPLGGLRCKVKVST